MIKSTLRMKFFDSYLLALLICLFSLSCANYRLNYSNDQKNWEENTPGDARIEHTMFLIGDAGNSKNGKMAPALQVLKNKLDLVGENSSVIFLGDNIYPGGMPPKSDEEGRKDCETKLDAQLATLENFKGRPIFIPGNHDWRFQGLKGVKRQEKYIEKFLNKGIEDEDNWTNYFRPDDGCSGPEIIELSDDIVVIVIDSQWFMEDWDTEPQINDGCEAKSRKIFQFMMEEALRKYRRKNVVVAMHHPLYSYGPHGGYFTVKQHLFPLTELDENSYIPLPGIGSIAAFLRGTVGTKSDLSSHRYSAFIETMLFGAKKNGRFIFASGHEHNLQYIEQDNQYQIVSGNGSKQSPARVGKGADFAYGGSNGFSQLDFYKDGSVWMKFWVVDKDNPAGKEVFRKKIKDRIEGGEENMMTDFPDFEENKDTIDTHLFTEEVKGKGAIHKVLLGAHYRDLYRQQYKMEVLDLSTFRGGMTPVKRGGGNQTNSLRLIDPNGKQFVMRSMQKDASRFLPYPFNKLSFAEPIVKDNFMSTHPFAAIAVSTLAEASGVYHTNPKLYYVPKQPALGIYNDDFGGAVYLVEERPDDDWKELDSFGNSEKIVSTDDVVEKLLKNHKHKVDQNFVARARLFDLVIYDFDRHNDQWRWASFKDEENEIRVYRPIPRDRDQPFAKYDGLITQLITGAVPFLKQLYVYSPDTKNMKWLTYGARSFDRTFMNQLSWEDWEKEVKHIQQNLTDEVIDKAFKSWPAYAYTTTGENIAEITKKRRDGLMDLARRHYLLVAKNVDVFGTEKKELFKVERLSDEETRVSVYQLKNKTRDSVLVYSRIFYTNETKEIRLYGEAEEDRFHFTGSTKKGILVRAVGGLDEDHFLDESYVRSGPKKTKIYDTPTGNIIYLGKEGKDMTSNDPEKNIFNKSDYHYEYDYSVFRPLVGFNPDDGYTIGGDLLFTKYNFKKNPYSSTHLLEASYSFATKGLGLEYEGNYVEAIGNANLLLEGEIRGPRFVENFFGLGNESKITSDEDDFDYNRVRNSLIRLKTGVKKPIGGGGGFFSFGPFIERVKVEKTEGRFVTDEASNLPANIFDPKYYSGVETGVNVMNVNNSANPTRGIIFTINAGLKFNLTERRKAFVPFKTELTIYESLTKSESIVFASRIGTEIATVGYEFFQAPVLGGNSNLRGYRSERFSGDGVFYHNNDIRIRLINSGNTVLPLSIGISGGFDYGKVWLKNEVSDTWHYSYGGGIWIAPLDFLIFSAQYFKSPEDQRVEVKVGHTF
jgi:surface antigen Omp85-like protein/calcineurin-like phosphoesterase family protein